MEITLTKKQREDLSPLFDKLEFGGAIFAQILDDILTNKSVMHVRVCPQTTAVALFLIIKHWESQDET